jgi:hypothetical protein
MVTKTFFLEITDTQIKITVILTVFTNDRASYQGIMFMWQFYAGTKLIKNTINNAAYSYAIAGVATGSHSSWRRGSPHPQMSMSPSADREQAAAPPMRPWVRRSSRTCPRPHRVPVSHSGRGHRSDQDGVPSCCCYPPLAGIMKSAARLTPPPHRPLARRATPR